MHWIGNPLSVSYGIIVTQEAEGDLDTILPFHRNRILDAMEEHLVHSPTRESRSRIKRLRALDSPAYRLRVGDFRVFYDVSQVESTVTVLRVLSKEACARYLGAVEVSS